MRDLTNTYWANNKGASSEYVYNVVGRYADLSQDILDSFENIGVLEVYRDQDYWYTENRDADIYGAWYHRDNIVADDQLSLAEYKIRMIK